MGRKVSNTVVIVLKEYIIFGLQGDKDTTILSIILSVSVTWKQSVDVAVAVNATILTSLCTRQAMDFTM